MCKRSWEIYIKKTNFVKLWTLDILSFAGMRILIALLLICWHLQTAASSTHPNRKQRIESLISNYNKLNNLEPALLKHQGMKALLKHQDTIIVDENTLIY